jgi:BASS family bile acid:Na+ symporter
VSLNDIPALTLFAMMLAMGMTLGPGDFRRILVQPAAFALGTVGQLLLLPAVAFALAWVFGLEGPMAIGLVLIAACPGGTTSNAVSYLARGDVALSISLTAVSSSVAFLTVPFVLGLALAGFASEGAELSLPFAESAVRLGLTTALPVALGMIVRGFWPRVAERWHRPLLNVTLTVLLFLILALFVSLTQQDVPWSQLVTQGTPPVLALLLLMTSFGLLAARVLGLDAAQGRTIAIEVGIQNFALAMVVALSMLERPEYLGVALLYAATMFTPAFAMVARARRGERREARAREPQLSP